VANQKIDKLDEEGRMKIAPYLNLNLNCDIEDIVFVYLNSQIYARIKQIVKNIRKMAE
jgi:hypothetical protein